MKNRTLKGSLAVSLAVLAVVMLLVLAGSGQPQMVLANTTPQAPPYVSKVGALKKVDVATASTLTASGVVGLTDVDTRYYNSLESFVTIDQGTTNTVTLKLQTSVDRVTWYDEVTLATASVADTSFIQVSLPYGLYHRWYATLGNSNTLTFTIDAVLKN